MTCTYPDCKCIVSTSTTQPVPRCPVYGGYARDWTDEPQPALGPCCNCERNSATNMMMLPRRGAIPGRGWGCVVCGLPAEGAVVVLCNACIDIWPPKFACVGYPATDGRQPFDALPPGDFKHDLSKHEPGD